MKFALVGAIVVILVAVLLIPIDDADALTEDECLQLASNSLWFDTVVTCENPFDVTVNMGQRLHIQNPNGGSHNMLPAANFGSPGTYQYTVSDGWASGTIRLVNPPDFGFTISDIELSMSGSNHNLIATVENTGASLTTNYAEFKLFTMFFDSNGNYITSRHDTTFNPPSTLGETQSIDLSGCCDPTGNGYASAVIYIHNLYDGTYASTPTVYPGSTQVTQLTIDSFEVFEDGSQTRYTAVGDAPPSTDLTLTMTKPDGSDGDYNGGTSTGDPAYNHGGLISPTSSLMYGNWILEVCAPAYDMCVQESFTINEPVTSVFTTVSSIDSQGNTCLGFENLSSGTQTLALLGPQDGNGNWYFQGSQWHSWNSNVAGSTFFDGVSCHTSSSAMAPGEYQYVALSHPTASPSAGNIIEYSTPITIQAIQDTTPPVITNGWSVSASANSVTLPVEGTSPGSTLQVSITNHDEFYDNVIEVALTLIDPNGVNLEHRDYDKVGFSCNTTNVLRCNTPAEGWSTGETKNVSITTDEFDFSVTPGTYTWRIWIETPFTVLTNTEATFTVVAPVVDTTPHASIQISADKTIFDRSIDPNSNPSEGKANVAINYQNLNGDGRYIIKTPDGIEHDIGGFSTSHYLTSGQQGLVEHKISIGSCPLFCSQFDSFTYIVSNGVTRGELEFQIFPPYQPSTNSTSTNSTSTTPAVTPAVTPDVTPAVTPDVTPAVTPAVTSTAPVTPSTNKITVQTNRETYSQGNPIILFGKVSSVIDNDLISLKISKDGSVIDTQSFKPTSKGEYTKLVISSGNLWDSTGNYRIDASYDGATSTSNFYFTASITSTNSTSTNSTSTTNQNIVTNEIQIDSSKDLKISLNKENIKVGETITIRALLDGIVSEQNVAVSVIDPNNKNVVSRTITVENSDQSSLQFKLVDNAISGTYIVKITSLMNGQTISDSAQFTVVSSNSGVKIVSIEPTDQQGNTVSTFAKNKMGFVKVVLSVENPINSLVTVNLFDSKFTSLGVGSFKTQLSGDHEIILSFFIPEFTTIGNGEIYTNVFSEWPSVGGIPLTGESSSKVILK